MSEEHVVSRHAAPRGVALTPGRTYVGRYVKGTGILLYAAGSTGIDDPLTNLAEGTLLESFDYAPIPQIYGYLVDGMFCSVTVGERGAYNIQFFGVDFAWFDSFITADNLTVVWSMKGQNGVGEVFVQPYDPQYPGPPFFDPFDVYRVSLIPGEVTPPALVAIGEPVFVSAAGIGTVSENPWRLEYQACDIDDPLNDVVPGIRAAWNFLCANCCGGDDDEENGVGDDDDPYGGGGGGGGGRQCDDVHLACIIVVQQCVINNPRPAIFWRWCLIDEEMRCVQETGGACGCDTRFDIFKQPIPPPGTLPPGTTLTVGCGFPGDQTFPKCSEMPQGAICS